MTESLLDWMPLLWTLRAVALILLVGGGWCAFLYFLRFVRPKHVRAMWNARLPRIRKFGGTLIGNDIGLELDEGQDEQFEAINRRMSEIEARRTIDRQAVEEIGRYLLAKEAQHELFNRKPGPHPGAVGGDADSERDR
jgi:hypothetical protein